ncbi:cytochrome c-type biogenesis protein [Methyloferula stellata]|uniref:cytochrome c-type biogenesis protein n=1 Tax=Methyloferula stellata TaxID=876270 RepID=UPI0003A9420B|nr:cytochrome c-type biogenesis protein [Methyloferula stellata]
MRKRFLFAGLAIVAMQPLPAFAVRPDEMLKDPALEARARALSSELRCMVCQNESIDESDAPLAHDLRVLVREHLQAGESEAAIRQYLVARYGDFILLKPPFKAETFLLWLTPLLVLVLGGAGIALVSRRRSQAVAPLELNAEEQARLADLLKK